MRCLVFIFFILLFGQNILAQTGKIRFYIKASEDHEPLGEVVVENVSTSAISKSDAFGYVELIANAGQQIQLERVGLRTKRLVVTDRMLLAQQLVFLSYDKIMLDSFEVLGKTQYQIDSLERAERYTRVLSHQKDKPDLIIVPTGLIVTNPISSWLQYIAPTTRAKFKFQKRFKDWEEQKYIETKYSSEIVYSITHLQSDSLAWFMNTYPMSYEMARYQSNTVIASWIKANFEDWKLNTHKLIERIQIKE